MRQLPRVDGHVRGPQKFCALGKSKSPGAFVVKRLSNLRPLTVTGGFTTEKMSGVAKRPAKDGPWANLMHKSRPRVVLCTPTIVPSPQDMWESHMMVSNLCR